MYESTETVLKGQLPGYFRPIIEFQEILKAHGYAIDQIEEEMSKLRNNLYITTCDEETIAYYENLFGILYRFGDTMDFRKSRVMQRFNTIAPFSIEFLRDKLTELYGEDGYILDIDPLKLILYVKVTSDRYGAVDLLYDLLWNIVPAHVQISANQQTTIYVPGRGYVGGGVSGTFIQTIHQHTVTELEGKLNSAGIVSRTIINTI